MLVVGSQGRLRRPRRAARGSAKLGRNGRRAAEVAEAAAVEREADEGGDAVTRLAITGMTRLAATAVAPAWPTIASAPTAAPW